MVRIVFFGSMTNTLRIVNAIPFSSTFVASWWSILHAKSASDTVVYARSRSSHVHVVHKRNLALLVADDWEAQLAPRDLINVFDPATVALDRVRAQSNELDIALGEFGLELRECAEFGCADLSNPVSIVGEHGRTCF